MVNPIPDNYPRASAALAPTRRGDRGRALAPGWVTRG